MMGFISFSKALSEEEQMLKQKYIKLRKRKRQLQLQSIKTTKADTNLHPTDNKLQHSTDSAGEATEQAKRLVQTGAIKVGCSSKDKIVFKRSKYMEEKLNDKPKSCFNFQPFSSKTVSGRSEEHEFNEVGMKSTYATQRENSDFSAHQSTIAPRIGKKVLVQGNGLTVEVFRNAFARFENILHLYVKKGNYYATFDKEDAASKAVAELNGCLVNDVHLTVKIASHKNVLDDLQDNTENNWCSSVAKAQSNTGSYIRECVHYDELFD